RPVLHPGSGGYAGTPPPPCARHLPCIAGEGLVPPPVRSAGGVPRRGGGGIAPGRHRPVLHPGRGGYAGTPPPRCARHLPCIAGEGLVPPLARSAGEVPRRGRGSLPAVGIAPVLHP